ncbi:unnamed protein product [Sphagnum balticum]
MDRALAVSEMKHAPRHTCVACTTTAAAPTTASNVSTTIVYSPVTAGGNAAVGTVATLTCDAGYYVSTDITQNTFNITCESTTNWTSESVCTLGLSALPSPKFFYLLCSLHGSTKPGIARFACERVVRDQSAVD